MEPHVIVNGKQLTFFLLQISAKYTILQGQCITYLQLMSKICISQIDNISMVCQQNNSKYILQQQQIRRGFHSIKKIKTQISNLVRTTRFWNNLHHYDVYFDSQRVCTLFVYQYLMIRNASILKIQYYETRTDVTRKMNLEQFQFLCCQISS